MSWRLAEVPHTNHINITFLSHVVLQCVVYAQITHVITCMPAVMGKDHAAANGLSFTEMLDTTYPLEAHTPRHIHWDVCSPLPGRFGLT